MDAVWTVHVWSTALRPTALFDCAPNPPYTACRRRGISPIHRVAVAALVVLVAVLAWAFTIHQAMRMEAMEAAMWRDMNMSMNGMEPPWTPVDALMVFVMWSAMMAAMMVPGASPMIAAFATINRRRRDRSAPYVPTSVFLLGYLIVWIGFSFLATGALAAGAFVAGASAADADDRILYDGTTGRLWFDVDGNGAAQAVLFAAVTPGVAMTVASLLVVP